MHDELASINPKKKVRITIAVIVICLLAGGLWMFDRWAFHGPINYDGREIPPWGLVDNPRSMGHPGHPEVVEAALHQIYAAMVAFRAIHGRLPTPTELEDWSKPLAPGHQLTQADFKYKDDYLSDSFNPLNHHNSELQFCYMDGKRPDGTPMPAFPRAGKKDAWLVCYDYAHENVVYTRKGPTRSTPTGFYVVLYSDGSVVRVPYGDALQVPCPDGSHNLEMPGVAGLPKGAVTQKKFDKETLQGNVDYSHENQAVLP